MSTHASTLSGRKSAAVCLALVLLSVGCGAGEKARPSSSPAGPGLSASVAVPSVTGLPRVVAALPAGDDTTVEEVVDGDTLVVTGGVRVRLIGVDTPETKDPRRGVQCYGAEAAKHTGRLLAPGTKVHLAYDVERRDRYGRTLAYVYRLGDGLLVNAALVRDGYAQVATFPPNVARADELLALQRQAREAGRGLWSACPQRGTSSAVPQAPTTVTPAGGCHSSYQGTCIPPHVEDADCSGGSGNGPYYVEEKNFGVVGPDEYDLDADDDGMGCEER